MESSVFNALITPDFTQLAAAGYRIVQLTHRDWHVYRDLRLQALSESHGLLGGCIAEERARTPAQWRRTLTEPGRAIWILDYQCRPVGMTGVALDEDDPSGQAIAFRASWIAPAHRGRGVTRFFHHVRKAWAVNETAYATATVSHRDGNRQAERAIRQAGFEHVETIRSPWPDGTFDLEHVYALDLAGLRGARLPLPGSPALLDRRPTIAR
jgi:RimJ/RimL family protein N-acetyltransferase